jgi:flagellar motor protein MotB
MRVVLASVIGLCCTFHSAWAVEVATAQTTANSVAAAVQPAVATTTAAPKPAIIPVVATAGQTVQPAENKPLTAEQIAKNKAQQEAKVKALVKDQATRLQQLEKANLEALAQNQELQLRNDNLGVQVQVLQSERSAQMFLYGAATIAVGVLLGFLIASYVYTKRRRQW